MISEYPTMSATEIGQRISAGEVTASAVIASCIDRIERLNPEFNAFISVYPEEARKQAEQLDKRFENGDIAGPLHGIPIAIKDLTPVAGMRHTAGSAIFADRIAVADDLFVEQLRNAGAIIVGKTNTPEFGRLTVTRNSIVGTTRNPWNPNRTVGGSSGGSAAALAAGMVPLATGTDAAGSLRIPAAACGVVGFMPDFGRVPTHVRPDAFMPLHPYSGAGPMARTVEDVALLLDVISGYDRRDPLSRPNPIQSYRSAITADDDIARIAATPTLGLSPVSSTVRAKFESALSAINHSDVPADVVDTVFTQDWTTLHDALEILLQDRYLAIDDTLQRDQGLDLTNPELQVNTKVVERIQKARNLRAIDVRRAERIRTEAIDAVENIFDTHSIILTPTITIEPFAATTLPDTVDGQSIDPYHGWVLTWPFNLTGHPAISIPAGFTDTGLPIGLQLVGKRSRDDQVVRAATYIESVLDIDPPLPAI